MRIILKSVGKRFNKQWIFKNIDFELEENSRIAIIGANGSGKSTLMQIMAGYLSPSVGSVAYEPDLENIQLHFNYAAPYYELIEEYTLTELLHFHSQFKNPKIKISEMCKRANLTRAQNKPLMLFSSGMKQRVKLILAFFFDSKVIFLDEPTANLDEEGALWYKKEIEAITDSCILIASNQKFEYSFTSEHINIENFK
ncbi:MAG: ATP-binding cassette domain-containing protein [Cyclobacteriaceae bacterium]